MASPHVARDISFCGHTVAGGELVIVEDATKDPRFIGNPLVTGEARLRAYIGIPLFTEAGYCVGSFCVLDREPRRFDENQVATLRNLAVMAQKELNNVGLNRNLAAAEPIAPAPVTAEAPFGARGWDILVVDDNPVNQHVIRMFLQKFGCAVECVDGGSECLQWLSERTCDLVFMDVQMPDMDGYETARRIRATEPGSRKPWIVALTAHAMAEAREMCLEAGMDDYLTKPVRRDMLREALDRFAASREA
jgi:CheY-like chemotaxis protein